MQFPDQKNISFALVGKNVTATANALLVDEYTDISDGSIALVDLNNKAMNGQTLTADMMVKFVQRSGTNLIYTPAFKVKDATCKLSGYTAATEQVSYIGYNGSTGSLDVIDNNNYVINVALRDYQTGRTYNKFAAYKSISSGATQAQIVNGLFQSFLRRFATEPFIRVDRTNNATTVTAFTGSSTVTKFTKGSTTVAVYIKATAANATLTASTASVTAADVINIPSVEGRTFTFDCLDAVGHTAHIGGESYYIADQGTAADGSDNATALAAAINASSTVCTASAATATVTITYNKDFYALPPMVFSNVAASPTTVVVTVATGNAVPVKYTAAATTSAAATFELDTVYQGETGYVVDGTVAATNSGVATTITSWGLKLTGVNQPFSINKYAYQKVNFDVYLDGFTTTTVTGKGINSIGVAPNQGINTSEQVAELVEFCNYNYGKTLRGIYLSSDALTNDVVSGTQYEVATILAKKTVDSGLGVPMGSPFTIYLCFHKDSNQGDNIATSLNTYYGSGAFA